MNFDIRDATAADAAALQSIYAHHVIHGFGTFDEVPPDLAATQAKWREVTASGLPWLAAVEDDVVVGFAYASAFRPRTAYRYTVEDSVYIRDDRRGRGVGAKLLEKLLTRCEAVGARQLIAVIGDSQNTGSIALHAKAGFARSGLIKGVGFKLGRWVDVVMMQRALNGGDSSTPPALGAGTQP